MTRDDFKQLGDTFANGPQALLDKAIEGVDEMAKQAGGSAVGRRTLRNLVKNGSDGG